MRNMFAQRRVHDNVLTVHEGTSPSVKIATSTFATATSSEGPSKGIRNVRQASQARYRERDGKVHHVHTHDVTHHLCLLCNSA